MSTYCPTKEKMIEKLRNIADTLEAGEAIPVEFSWSSDFEKCKYKFVFEVQLEQRKPTKQATKSPQAPTWSRRAYNVNRPC